MTIDDDTRWRAALSLARGNPTPEAEALLARQRRLRWRWLSVLIVAAVLIGVVIGLTAGSRNGGRRSSTAEVPGWRTALGFSLVMIGLVLLVIVLVRMSKSGRFRMQKRSPLLVLTMAQRRGLVRQVRGKQPVAPDHLPVARFLATMIISQRQSALTLLPLGVVFTGNAVMTNRTFTWVYAAAFVVLLIVARASSGPQIARAHGFLEQHPDASTPSTFENTVSRPVSDS